MTLPRRLSEILQRCEAATPGPWKVEYDNDTGPQDDYYVEWFTAGPAKVEGRDANKDDADFIAHARTDLPLVTEALQKAVEALERIKPGNYPYCGCDSLATEALTEIEKLLSPTP